MRSGRRLLPAVVLLGVLAATTAVALAGSVSWGSAIEVPGTAALNVGGYAGLYSVSCASAGNCAAGGYYRDGSALRALVVSEQGGVWGTAKTVPGSGGNAEVASVSCAAAGDCAAGGGPVDPDFGFGPAFVVDEVNGSWGTATAVRGLAHLNGGGDATVTSVSCGRPGDCAAAGYYSADTDKYGWPTDFRAFVVSETSGTWSTAKPVPVGAVFRGGYDSTMGSVSCAGVGYCVAGGSARNRQAFVVVARNGSWGKGTAVPGMAALTGSRGVSEVDAVSCTSPGTCAAVGWYIYGGRFGRYHLFVVAQRNGKWGTASKVSGIPALSGGSLRLFLSVSCASAGNCAGGGWYRDRSDKQQAFVVAEKNRVWGTAVEVPGTATLNVGGDAWVASVSCASAGNCAASGKYLDGDKTFHSFVVSEQDGVWGTAVDVPGTAALDVGVGGVGFPWQTPISCAGAGRCAIGGSYRDSSGAGQAFVTAP